MLKFLRYIFILNTHGISGDAGIEGKKNREVKRFEICAKTRNGHISSRRIATSATTRRVGYADLLRNIAL